MLTGGGALFLYTLKGLTCFLVEFGPRRRRSVLLFENLLPVGEALHLLHVAADVGHRDLGLHRRRAGAGNL